MRFLTVPLLGLALLASSYRNAWPPAGESSTGPAPASVIAPTPVTDGNGLEIRIALVPAPAPAGPTQPRNAVGVPLDSVTVARLLARLPAMAPGDSERREFSRRAQTPPPPRAGATVQATFPPPQSPPLPTAAGGPPPDAGDLAVLRYAPEGEVPIAPSLEITYSQPMVAVTSVEALAAAEVPVRLMPQPPGQWRWIGTRTLVFEPVDRFPMASEFTVDVPAGLAAVGGARLRAPLHFSFATPRARLIGHWPYDDDEPETLEPTLFLDFDQRIDPAALLPFVELRSAGRQGAWPLRLATAPEIAAGEGMVGGLPYSAGRRIALRPRVPLPRQARLTLEVRPGAPSAEGPRRSDAAQSFRFQTYGPLVLERRRAPEHDELRPGASLSLAFSNRLDETRFREDWVRVTPTIPELEVTCSGNVITLAGGTLAHTTYRVRIDGHLVDIHGQTLGRAVEVSLTVGATEPRLMAPGEDFVVLDPAGPPRFSVYAAGLSRLHVRGYPVTPANLDSLCWLRRSWQMLDDPQAHPDPDPLKTPASLSLDLKLGGTEAPLTEVPIDLSPVLTGQLGTLLLIVYTDPLPPDNRVYRVARWIESTRIGVDAFADAESLYVWATDLQTGRPRVGALVERGPDYDPVRTNEDGIAVLPASHWYSRTITVRQGADLALLSRGGDLCNQVDVAWHAEKPDDHIAWFLFDDRHLYRPGEEFRFKGWVRLRQGGPRGDLAPAPAGVEGVRYAVREDGGREVAKGVLPLNALGGFAGALQLPAEMRLGSATLELLVWNGAAIDYSFQRTNLGFRVEEFRRPEYEVRVTGEPGPLFVGDSTAVTAEARYFAGGGLPDAPVAWRVDTQPATFTPPNRAEYAFGIDRPRMEPWRGRKWGGRPPRWRQPTRQAEGRTDSRGQSRLRIDLDRLDPPCPALVAAEARVSDVNRQVWVDRGQLLVHPAAVYAGLRAPRTFVRAGESLGITAIVCDLEGRLQAGRPLHMEMARLEWIRQGGTWQQVLMETRRLELVSRATPLTATFFTTRGGSYRVSATTTDTRGRPSLTRLDVWVSGDQAAPPNLDSDALTVTLVADKPEYRPGDQAEILVVAPFFPAEGFLTLRREGVLRRERFHMTEATQLLHIPIEEAWTPNIGLGVELLGQQPRVDMRGGAAAAAPPSAAWASGSVELNIPPATRRLMIAVAPRDSALAPGGSTRIDLTVRDAAGRPVRNADVAVAVVDESVLALAGFHHPDPLDSFYARGNTGILEWHSRASLVLARAPLGPASSGQGGLINMNLPINLLARARGGRSFAALGIPYLAGGEAISPTSWSALQSPALPRGVTGKAGDAASALHLRDRKSVV